MVAMCGCGGNSIAINSAHEEPISRLAAIDSNDDISRIFKVADRSGYRYTAIEKGTMTFCEARNNGVYLNKRRYMVERMLRIFRHLRSNQIMLRTSNLDSFCIFISGDDFRVKLINLHCAKEALNNEVTTQLSRQICAINNQSTTRSTSSSPSSSVQAPQAPLKLPKPLKPPRTR